MLKESEIKSMLPNILDAQTTFSGLKEESVLVGMQIAIYHILEITPFDYWGNKIKSLAGEPLSGT